MSREKRIIASICTERSAYEEIKSLVQEEDFSVEGWCIVQQIQEYYDRDSGAKAVDCDWLADAMHTKYPKNGEIFQKIIGTFDGVSVPNTLKEYLEQKKAAIGSLLSQALVQQHFSDVEKYMKIYNDMDTEPEAEDLVLGIPFEQVLEEEDPNNLIKVFPSALNDRLDGGVTPGTQIAVYAPTETGKSLFAINMTGGFLSEGRKVLYVGNEDSAASLYKRIWSRLTGATRAELMMRMEELSALAKERGSDNLVLKHMEPGTIREVEGYVRKYRPEILVVDQMANMESDKSFSKVEKNEHLAVRFRELAARYDLVTVILHQASDDAYGKLHVEKNDMYYSNVGVQGQMDLMIGIGADAQYEANNMRMLCLTKNKRSANHDHFPVLIQPELSKVITIQ